MESKLEKAVGGYGRKPHILEKFVKRVCGKYVCGYWFGGALREKYQEEIAPTINSTPPKMSLINALLPGLVGAFQFHFFGELGGYVVSCFSDKLGVAPEFLGDFLTAFDFVQSLYRIGYVAVKKKGIMSFSVIGLVGSGGYWYYKKVRKKRYNQEK